MIAVKRKKTGAFSKSDECLDVEPQDESSCEVPNAVNVVL